jgi:hypothetical protein
MAGLTGQALLTPQLVQRNIDIQKARQIYSSRLQQYLGVPIGSPINSNPDTQPLSWLTWIKANADANGKKQMCLFVKYANETYDTINSLVSRNPANTYTTEAAAMQANTDLQERLLVLTRERDALLEDNEVSEMRNSVLRSGNAAITNHQVYLLGRPLRPASIPYIWALIVLYIGLGILIFYTFIPYTMPPLDIVLLNLYYFFANPWVWSILFGMASIVILFLSLHIANII